MTTRLPTLNQRTPTAEILLLTEGPANAARIEAVAVKAKAAAIAVAIAVVIPKRIPVMIAMEAIEGVVRRRDLLETSRKRKLLSIWQRKHKRRFLFGFPSIISNVLDFFFVN